MRVTLIQILLILLFSASLSLGQDEPKQVTKSDTSYNSLATSKIINMLKKGKAPRVTLQLSFNYNIGHMDLAGNENTLFRKEYFINGGNFGTRYGYGGTLTGKIALHKEGNLRLNVTAGYNRFQSNFVIAASPEGKVSYNVLQGALGLENNFCPTRQFKPYIGFDAVASLISGNATLATDSTDFALKIKSSLRLGITLNTGFEYAVNDKVGFNLGYKITFANALLKESKASSNAGETYLNDEKLASGSEPILFAGWKQFLYSSFYAGVNFYFGMKNKK